MTGLDSINNQLPLYPFLGGELHLLARCNRRMYQSVATSNFFQNVLRNAGIAVAEKGIKNYLTYISASIYIERDIKVIISLAQQIILSLPYPGTCLIGLALKHEPDCVKTIIQIGKTTFKQRPLLAEKLVSAATYFLPKDINIKFHLARFKVKDLTFSLPDNDAFFQLGRASSEESLRDESLYLGAVLYAEGRVHPRCAAPDKMLEILRLKNTPLSKIYMHWLELCLENPLLNDEQRFEEICKIDHPLADFLKAYMFYHDRTTKISADTAHQLLKKLRYNQKISVRWRFKALVLQNCLFASMQKKFSVQCVKLLLKNFEDCYRLPYALPIDRHLAYIYRIQLLLLGYVNDFDFPALIQNLRDKIAVAEFPSVEWSEMAYYLARLEARYGNQSTALDYFHRVLKSDFSSPNDRKNCRLQIIALKLSLNHEIYEDEILLLNEFVGNQYKATKNEKASAKLSLVIMRYKKTLASSFNAKENLKILQSINKSANIEFLLLKKIYQGLIHCYRGSPCIHDFTKACRLFQEVIKHPRALLKDKCEAMLEFAKITFCESIEENFSQAYEYLLSIEKEPTSSTFTLGQVKILRIKFAYFGWTKLLTEKEALLLCIHLFEREGTYPPTLVAEARLYAALLRIKRGVKSPRIPDGWALLQRVADDEKASAADKKTAYLELARRSNCMIL